MSEGQVINIVTDVAGELRVSSLVIAERTSNQHASVLRIVREHQPTLEQFGLVGFEIAPRSAGQHGGGDMTIALLNEPQSTLLMTFMRNSPVVVGFKVELVRQFHAMRQALSEPRPPAQLDRRQLALLVIEAEDAREAAEQQVAELAPRAGAWDEIASAQGDHDVADAAMMLQRAGIKTGRDRLFESMRGVGWVYRSHGRWRAMQSAVDSGYLRHKPQSHTHPDTGERVIDPPQVRVTMKGIERLRVRLQQPVAELATT